MTRTAQAVLAVLGALALTGLAAGAGAPALEKPALVEVNPELRCGSGLLGGYSPVPLPNSQANYLAMAALPTYVLQASNDGSLGSCSPSGPGQVTQVLAACSQVVAGTNYDIVYTASIPCSNAPAQAVTLEARVFVPLPYANLPPTVKSVTRLT